MQHMIITAHVVLYRLTDHSQSPCHGTCACCCLPDGCPLLVLLLITVLSCFMHASSAAGPAVKLAACILLKLTVDRQPI